MSHPASVTKNAIAGETGDREVPILRWLSRLARRSGRRRETGPPARYPWHPGEVILGSQAASRGTFATIRPGDLSLLPLRSPGADPALDPAADTPPEG
jgi:hypothetical protein